MACRMLPSTSMRTDSIGYRALAEHHAQMREIHMRRLFEDPARFEEFSLEAGGLFLDYSKNRVTRQTMDLLVKLAEESGLRQRIDQMFRGEKINTTEDR